ncbi:MAG: hypothetical protein EA000_16900 [Oscillatoriales cyanobacterium]|nr:MAG: hypothetical protein EA000_16900 [Oscillatoriales cyanobacterium]
MLAGIYRWVGAGLIDCRLFRTMVKPALSSESCIKLSLLFLRVLRAFAVKSPDDTTGIDITRQNQELFKFVVDIRTSIN